VDVDLDDSGLRGFERLEALDLPTLFPNAEALSLRGLGIQARDAAGLAQVLTRMGALRAVWLNDNPIATDLEALAVALTPLQGRLEVVNRRLTEDYGAWALRYLGEGGGGEAGGPRRLDLRGRGMRHLKPRAFQGLVELEWLDIRRNTGLWEGHDAEVGALEALRALPKLRSLWLDAPEGLPALSAEALAMALPGLRYINGRAIYRRSDGCV
jgi:hypothetical protein